MTWRLEQLGITGQPTGLLLAQGMPSSEACTTDPKQAAEFATPEQALDRLQRLPEARWPMWRVVRKAGAKP